jgi:nucleosome assembly protein 1-like 1
LYERRAEIVAGNAEPTETEVEEGKAADSDNEDEDDDEEEGGAKITEIGDSEKSKDAGEKGIPEFWLTALRNHAAVSDTIEEHDEKVSFLLHCGIAYL